MNIKKNPNLNLSGLCILGVMIFLVLNGTQVIGQEIKNIKPDSISGKRISLEKIPASSAKTIVTVAQIKESLITEEQIESIRISDGVLIRMIDSLLEAQENSDLLMLNNRNLRNLGDSWSEKKIQVSSSIERLTLIIKKLNDAQTTLEREFQLWKNVKQVADSLSSVHLIISDVTNQINNVKELVLIKTNEILILLNDATQTDLKLDYTIASINEAIQKQRAVIFSKTHPSIFKIDYNRKLSVDFGRYFNQFYRSDIAVLLQYFKIKKDLFIFYLFYLIMLLGLFYYLKNRTISRKTEPGTLFDIVLKKIFQLPFSAASTLGLFSVVFIFSNRPMVFNDFILLLFTIPLINIFLAVTSNIKKLYILMLGFLIALRMVTYMFPPEFILHRFIIIVMGVTEIIVSLDLYAYFKRQKYINEAIRIVTLFFIILHLFIATTGIICNIYGSVLVAGMAVNFVITNTLIGFLITVSVIILIGLIQIAIDGNYLRRLNLVRKYDQFLKKRINAIIVVFASFSWLWAIFRLLGINDEVNSFISGLVSNQYKLGSISFSLGSILLMFFIIWLSAVASKMIKVILEEDILVRLPLNKGVPRMISVMTRYTLVTFGVFIAVSAAGMPLDSLTIIIGAFSVGIGFGLQNIFNNLVSGLILLFERPIQIGDVIEIGPLVGQVKSMGIRSSNLRTFDGAEVIVPNGNLISNEVINWTLSDKRKRIEIISGVAYGSDIHRVQKLFYKILDEHPDILKDPKPNVLFNNLSDSSLDFRLLFWTDNFDNWTMIRSEVMFRIYDVLNEAGIVIPFPQRDLHIKTFNDFQDIKKTKNNLEPI